LLKPENKAQLVEILTYHVVTGKVTSASLAGKKTEVAGERRTGPAGRLACPPLPIGVPLPQFPQQLRGRKMRRWLRWFGIAVGILFALFLGIPAIVVAVLALFYDWDDARPLVGRLASTALGREVAITDALDVDLGRVTRIDVRGLTVANVKGGKAPHLVHIGDLAVAIALKPLLSGNVVIPSLRLADVDAALERNADRRANWEFGGGRKPAAEPAPSKEPTRLPLIESLTVDGANISLDDRQLGGRSARRSQLSYSRHGVATDRPHPPRRQPAQNAVRLSASPSIS
jgi:hypothetical protein